MPLQKQNLSINFAQGLDLKTDPNQVSPGRFLELENIVFTKAGLLQKRNGFEKLPSLPDTTYKYVSTFSGSATAIGTSLASYSAANQAWSVKGSIRPIELTTLSLVKTSSNQSQTDSVIANNGLICTVFTETAPSTAYKYVVADSVTGQNVIAPTTLSAPSESPRVFLLGNYFMILWSESANLKYIAVPVSNPSSPGNTTTLVTNYSAGGTMLAFDGVVTNNNLYVSYNGNDGGGAIRMTYLNSFLVRQTASTGVNIANTKSATMMSVCADETTPGAPIIWAAFYKTAGTTGSVVAVDQQLTSVLASTQIISAGTILNITCTATAGSVTAFFEVSTTYSFGASLQTNILNKRSVTQAGSVGSATTFVRSLGLASKAFLMGSTPYMLAAYSSSYQPSYFLIDSSGNVVSKLAYENGGGYLTLGLPSVSVIGTTASVSYLLKDLLIAANKSQSPTSSTPVFTQTGISLAAFNFTTDGLNASEIGANLNISGGILWTYDGFQVVEQGFHLYPDNVIVTTSTSGGSIQDQTYFYVAIYEWTDNQGNIHRSAPSLPVKQITSGGNTSTNTIKVPTLRLTYKTTNPIKIVLYRWSTANQTYYQVTSLTSPTLNSLTSDNVTITDTAADSSIVGNSILYTTGGIVENIGAPPTKVMTLFKSRLFLVDSEDSNLIWYSKQVIESTPVELSDLFTVYIAPTIGAQINTGPISALSSMDDKLIIFKENAIYYLTGTGPDNTGANNDFTDPIFITATVGCMNQNSIAFIPAGLMFQSDKGIWLLGRDLSTTYIGAPVEDFNASTILSTVVIPGTNEVRFTLDTGEVLMYDYFFGQWCSFSGVAHIASTLFQDLQLFIKSSGEVYQENPGSYLDGSRPVLISFLTGWMSMAGLQGFERAYFFYLLANFFSPHKITVNIAFDFNPSAKQSVVITPDNFSGNYGDDPLYGDLNPFGGSDNLEQWRIFFQKQKCQSFQLQIIESFDASLGAAAGAGFTMSGINMVVGLKKAYATMNASRSIG